MGQSKLEVRGFYTFRKVWGQGCWRWL